MAQPKPPRDVNQVAKLIVDMATGQVPKDAKPSEAAENGRKGGLIGGKKRTAALPPKRRTEIAKQGAAARWGKKGA